ncbi:MAG TPA: hypothetical protein VFG15_03275 [Amycolatopsis sp.]|nr:hypothetical protein [Amycolatopsis sp.]
MHPIEVETEEEFAAVAHLRGWCHFGDLCAICRAERPLFAATHEARVSPETGGRPGSPATFVGR